ncbi:D-alanyl-D-alanine carboxypeptidase [Streptomyces marianii]|uniref:Peptidase S11 D-alanyl-D-alanine carboxypeptidase A N-terminal domain-containing protein n=1 Tax=Streptomyces marianii TaxID=1817406 RepID=A0A5R9E651_9ACTN|nr:D-alanyl-D-alanine carboxypeptidase [Streptomyces marianii]TLQ45356.1 hypothetical protein FEF34_22110 [Streptomyces marianii]
MAGESPDKSEQQKSSGETTPGERDPRLAVARSAGASTEGRADQSTAVFRTLPSEPEERAETSKSSEPTSSEVSADADAGTGTDTDTDTGRDASESAAGSDDAVGSAASEDRPADGDDRLRAAVAAWVSGKGDTANDTADGTADGTAEAGTAADEGTGGRTGGRPAPAAVRAGGASGDDEADAGAPEAVEGGDAPELAPSGHEAAEKAGRRPTAPPPRKSVDAEPSAGADQTGTDRTGTDQTGVDQARRNQARTGQTGTDQGEGDEDTAGGSAGGSTSDGSSPSEEGSRTRTPSWAAARRAGKDTAPAEDGPGGGPASGTDGVVAPTGSARLAVSAGTADEGDGAEEAGDRKAVDQPTAVFKALPRPAVDQPTTALKITSQPAAPKRAERSSASAVPSAQSDVDGADAERPRSEGAGKEAERTTALRVTGPPSERPKPEPRSGMKPGADDAPASDDAPGAEGTTGERTASGRSGASGSAPAAPASRPAPGRTSGDASESAAETAPGSAPESAAERTSTFVPLRRDDVRPAPSSAQSAPPTAKPAGPAASPAAPPASLTEPERTKQQPLPPRPPLDLLAELTNTPPPPQTPVRTLVRRVRIWTPLVVVLLIVFAVVQAVRPLPDPTLSLTAEPTYEFEGSAPQLPWPAKGQAYMAASGLGTLGSSGEQKPVPIASVTKSMTAYVILKNHPLKPGEPGPMIEIDAKGEAEGQLDKTDNESTLNTVKKGDKISLRDALAAIMIPSANNIARQLARWDSGSEKAFVEKMNAAADELGMKNTTYTDPSGLDATTVSTAEDQVKLGLKLVEIKALMDITKLPEWTDPSGKTWRNYNELPPYDGALGIKTGSTTKAGGNLLFAAHKMVGDTDQLIVGAVLAQYDTPILGTAIKASRELMLATQDALKNATIVKKDQVVGVVEDGLGGSIPLVATKDVKAVGWSGLTVKLELTNGGKVLPHEAAAGTVVGSLTVGEGASQVTVPVALQKALVEPGFGARLTRLG